MYRIISNERRFSRCSWFVAFRAFARVSRCGYTVSKVENGSVKLVHETSGKHYKDDMTFTLTDKEVTINLVSVSVASRGCRKRTVDGLFAWRQC